MGSRLTAGPAEALPPQGSDHRHRGPGHDGQTPPGKVEYTATGERTERSGSGPIGWLRDNLPRGNTLDERTFGERHRLLSWMLGLHLPALVAFALWQENSLVHALAEVAVPAGCLLLSRFVRPGRLAALLVSAGLVYCSAVLVHLSHGMIEAHFHFFILIGFIALYQDWVPFLWNVAFVVLSHGIGTAIDAHSMYNHPAAQNKPWLWASIHGTAVLAACTGVVLFWRHTEMVQKRNLALRSQLAQVELHATETEMVRKRSAAALLVHLARRNQPLLDRQLELIADLEQRERLPDTLAELFKLDHMATRMRRNAESLLVLSGDDPPRRWGRPVALAEVVRAAAAEVEAYSRVEIVVNESLTVDGRVVADLAHLLAELIENATTFSPPTADVRVNGFLSPSEGEAGAFLVSIEDTGIGMSEEDLQRANQILAHTPEVDANWRTLGLQVVSRLARRHGLQVRLAGTPGGGLTAIVKLPPELLRERRAVPEDAGLVSVFPDGSLPAVVPSPDGGPEPGWTLADPDAAARLVLPPPSPPGVRTTSTAPPGTLPAPPVLPLPAADGGDSSVRLWPSALLPTAEPSQPPPVEPPPAPPAPPGLAPPEPTPLGTRGPAEPPAAPPTVPPVEVVGPELTSEGLVRRVPGQSLAAPLRDGAPPGEAPGPGPLDREQGRSMLSRFQASQRAGRAVAAGPTGHVDENEPAGGEEDEE